MSNNSPGNGSEAASGEFVSGQKLFGRYTLKRTLGRGGMGIVWLARDDELERDVALKFLPDLIIHDRAVLSDLKRETRRSLELTHKNIVRIYDFVHDQVSGCISMEYVDGDTLSNLRADKPRKVFESVELKDWLSQMCDALDYAHNHARIVHRDLKPSNLMVNQRGDLKVADFGIARSLSDSMSMLTMEPGKSGTLLYMSPQQLDGERGNHLDDVYSLGASVYELLTSRPPFYSGNVDRQIREKVPPSMTQRRKDLEIEGEPIDAAWEEVVRSCLAKDPTKRPQAVTEIAGRLEVPSSKTRRRERDASQQADKSGKLLGAIAVVLIMAVGVWYLGFFRGSARKTSEAAMEQTRLGPAAKSQSPVAAEQIPPAMAATTGSVTVNTSPAGAMVALAGTDARKSPATFKDVRPGKYPVRITLDGYEPVEREVEVKENQSIDLGTIALSPGKAIVDLSSEPPGAKVLQNGVLLGTTPIKREDLPPGAVTFLLLLDGHLPRELKATLDPKEPFRKGVSLTQLAPIYSGAVRVRYDYNSAPRPLTIALGPDLKSGIMTQSSKRGDFVVKFNGIWEGTDLRAVTGEVVSQPGGVQWTPESFVLRFAEDGKSASYECVAEGKTYEADLAAQSGEVAKISSVYKGTIRPANVPLTINLSSDRKSGTMTQTGKSGDTVVKFNGIWDGTTLRAVTDEVVSKPKNVKWEPESFTLRFSDDGRRGTYECNSGGRLYTAELSPP